MTDLDANYWNQRYLESRTGWDIGYASPPLTDYFDTLTNKETKILIPGCGNAYEGMYLHEKGFTEVYLLDIAPEALEAFAKRNPTFPKEHLICGNFFDHQGQYDLIVEQTFFCALDPSLRTQYLQQMTQLLKPETGKLMGVLFNVQFAGGPPFGGQQSEYLPLFNQYLEVHQMGEATNSIPPRLGSEVFFVAGLKAYG